MKAVVEMLDFIKNFCSAKGIIKTMRRQNRDWKKMFAKDTCDKDYFPKHRKTF